MADTARPSEQRRGRLAGLPKASNDAAVRLTAIGFRALLNLRCRTQDARMLAALGDALGMPLPVEPNRVSGDDERAVLWLGPDEWLVLAADGEEHGLEKQLRAAADDDAWLSVVDVSHNYTGLMLAGPAARDVLAKGCPLDLHRLKFRPGDCAQTVLAGVRVLLRSPQQSEAIELWVRNSFARYTAHWLLDAMAEFPDPAPPAPGH
jgi:sarcosine oxidase subunit gamma